MKIIDITHTMNNTVPTYEDYEGFKVTQILDMNNNDECNVTQYLLNAHFGTHLDAPSHFIKNGITVEQLDLNILTGIVSVIDARNRQVIDKAFLETVCDKLEERVIFITDSGPLMKEKKFSKDFVHLTYEGAEYLIENGIKLVGIDYLSIESFYVKESTVHIELLKNNIVILEGLNLFEVKEGIYTLYALPLKIENSDGSPIRAILVQEN